MATLYFCSGSWEDRTSLQLKREWKRELKLVWYKIQSFEDVICNFFMNLVNCHSLANSSFWVLESSILAFAWRVCYSLFPIYCLIIAVLNFCLFFCDCKNMQDNQCCFFLGVCLMSKISENLTLWIQFMIGVRCCKDDQSAYFFFSELCWKWEFNVVALLKARKLAIQQEWIKEFPWLYSHGNHLYLKLLQRAHAVKLWVLQCSTLTNTMYR